MKIKTLKQYFKGGISSAQVVKNISDEVKGHLKLLEKKGGSAPVYITGSEHLKIGPRDVLKLCDAFCNQEMEEGYINYIANVMLLSENIEFESEVVEENVAYLSDPVVNGHFDDQFMADIRNSLS